jgi:hypothetical protein
MQWIDGIVVLLIQAEVCSSLMSKGETKGHHELTTMHQKFLENKKNCN